MILPIIAYGDLVLKKKAIEIDHSYPGLQTLIETMYETMYGAKGIGLAAPQVGLSIRVFIVDGAPFEEDEELKVFKKVFINAKINKESGKKWTFNEGCLSIPEVREDVERFDTIEIIYLDENFKQHTEVFSGIKARIIQHEYDHIEGILFTDRLSVLKKAMLKNRLDDVKKGKITPDYKMKFLPLKKKKR